MSTIITGDCSVCGEPVEVVDGVWPPGHGNGKCGRRAAFLRHLEEASRIVATWPEWKRNVLGRPRSG